MNVFLFFFMPNLLILFSNVGYICLNFELYFQFSVHIEVSSVFGIRFCLTDNGTMYYHAELIPELVCNSGCSCLQLCAFWYGFTQMCVSSHLALQA